MEDTVNEHLRRAVNALESGAAELRQTSLRSAGEVRDRLRRTVEEVLDHLEADEESREPDPEDVVARLHRQSQDIAEDLRRAERLMKQRMGRE
jgi:response regulator RpfG family c-di-GMP phosphodiesterase